MNTKNRKSVLSTGILIIVMFALFFYLGCDRRNPNEPTANELAKIITVEKEGSIEAGGKDTITMTATVKTITQVGISGARVTWAVVGNVGVLAPLDSLTNASGVVQARYWVDNPEVDTTVYIAAGAGSLRDSAKVEVSQVLNTIDLTSDSTMFAHPNDSIQIKAVLKNSKNQPLTSSIVNFSSSGGTITGTDTTNNSGIAYAWLKGSVPDSGQIVVNSTFAVYGSPDYAIGTKTITALPVATIGSITVSAAQSEITVGGSDSTQIIAVVTDTLNQLALDGTEVLFSCGPEVTISDFNVATASGIATTFVKALNNISNAVEITARNGPISGADTIRILAGLPDMIEVSIPEEENTLTVGSGETATISAIVKDEFQNPVRDGTQISFNHTLPSGIITPVGLTVEGIANAIYAVGENAGLDSISAMYIDGSDTIEAIGTITCLSSNANQMTLSGVPNSITVRGAGGQAEASLIRATVKDANQNPAADSTMVIFTIVSSPPGDSIQDRAYLDVIGRQVDTNYTFGGMASTNLIAGVRPGTVTINARVPGGPFAEQPLVTISSGPPAYISVGVGEVIVNGSSYQWEVSANVSDIHSNPVVDSTAVYFRLEPQGSFLIDGGAFTGNTSNQGYVLPGVAYTDVIYSCQEVFDTVSIFAESDTVEGAIYNVVVPLGDEAGFGCFANPGNLSLSDNNDVDTSLVTAILADDNNCPISGAIVFFTVETAGHLFEPVVDTTDALGMVDVEFWIRGIEVQSPNPPPQVTGTVKVILQANTTIEGEVNIVCTKTE
ncbi:MAG: hypothetical protein GY855_10515 [candidate division Zixibacteria bacterium]|nr:hypothetical protein [candidate division Zixibacteria bacterium]